MDTLVEYRLIYGSLDIQEILLEILHIMHKSGE